MADVMRKGIFDSVQKVQVLTNNHEEQDKQVKVRGQDTTIKEIIVEDRSGKVKVTMWRDAINREIHVGDHIQITDVITNDYRNEIPLSTTVRTTIKKSEAPLITDVVTVIGISKEEDTYEILKSDDSVVNIEKALLETAFPDTNLEMLTVAGPLTLIVKSKGSVITSIDKPIPENKESVIPTVNQ